MTSYPIDGFRDASLQEVRATIVEYLSSREVGDRPGSSERSYYTARRSEGRKS